jgi:hypothetical protein
MATTTIRSFSTASPAYQAYRVLHVGFVALPIIAGLDKFADLLTNWTRYLAPIVPRLTGVQPRLFMYTVGVVEICAGLLVAIRPRYGAYVVAAWLAAIILNLLLIPGYYDVALRDFGLALAAVALGRLTLDFDRA